MCAVIGVDCNNSIENINFINSLFIQSKIRGLHATGISFVENNKIVTIKESLSANEFIKRYNIGEIFKNKKRIKLIGHCRYSTSDLRFNQPISDDKLSIVHNGVVTQELFENWKNKYGYDCITQNDSELIFRALKDNNDIDIKFKGISFSLIILNNVGDLTVIRNSLRPLWKAEYDSNIFYASTKNIFLRSGFSNEIISKVESCDNKEKQFRHME